MNFQMFKLVLEKAEEPEIKLPTSTGSLASLVAQRLKQTSACNAGDLGSIPGLGRSPGEGNGNLFWYSCLENFMDRGAWWATGSQGRTRLSDFTFTFTGSSKKQESSRKNVNFCFIDYAKAFNCVENS